MAMRAQPVKVVFQRLSRVVRDVAAATGKRVLLTFAGEDTQVESGEGQRIGADDDPNYKIRESLQREKSAGYSRTCRAKRSSGAPRRLRAEPSRDVSGERV